jgi:predicted nucleotidyltransferase
MREKDKGSRAMALHGIPVECRVMVINGVNFPEEQIAEFCRRHSVAKLSLFGSILREPSDEGGYGFRPTSDVDVLVEFLPGQTPSLLTVGGMLMELQEMLGRQVDLRTPQDLSRYFRDEVLREARLLHAA